MEKGNKRIFPDAMHVLKRICIFYDFDLSLLSVLFFLLPFYSFLDFMSFGGNSDVCEYKFT